MKPGVFRTIVRLSALLSLPLAACSRPFPEDSLYLAFLLPPAAKAIFVTSSAYTIPAGFVGVSGADQRCATEAASAGYSGTFLALIVNGSSRIACLNPNCSPAHPLDNSGWVLRRNTVYYRAGDTTRVLFTANTQRIFLFGGGQLQNSLGAAASDLWTGLNQNWTTGNTCGADWSQNSNAETGDATALNADAISFSTSPCNSPATRLACVEQ